MQSEELKPHEGNHVRITLVDGTKKRGYLFGVGYEGVTLMRKGAPYRWRASQVKSIRKVRKFF